MQRFVVHVSKGKCPATVRVTVSVNVRGVSRSSAANLPVTQTDSGCTITGRLPLPRGASAAARVRVSVTGKRVRPRSVRVSRGAS